ncbi:MAG: leucine-rich repeat domain-containing protein [Myxococcota bacterium]
MNAHRDILNLRVQICAQPDDDALREALADAYATVGALDRAKFIQLQLQRSRLPRWDERAVELELEERQLLATHEEQWRRAELPASDEITWGPFERGLVRSAWAEPGGIPLLANVPLEHLFVGWPWRRDPPLPRHPGAYSLTMVGAGDPARLVRSPVFETTRSLTLLDGEFSRLDALVDHPLRALRIPHHHLQTAGLKALVEMPDPALEELVLIGAPPEEAGSGFDAYYDPSFDERGAYALALWEGLASVKRLDLSRNRIGGDGLHVLLGSPWAAALRALSIRSIAAGSWHTDDSLAALSVSTAHLEELDISDNALDASGAEALAESPALADLKLLFMRGVRSTHFLRLATASWIHELCVLEAGADALPSLLMKSPESLHTLVVHPGAARSLEDLPLLPSLRTLVILGVDLDDSWLHHLARSTAFPMLRELRVTPPHRFSEDALAAFCASGVAARLASFDFGEEHARLPRSPATAVGNGSYKGPHSWL